MADRYRAFLIGNTFYPEDPHNLQRLEGPINDITLLRAALEDPEVGMFAPGAVTLRSDHTSHELLSALDEFFRAGREEVVLLYYSGHGRLDETNTLYLCTRDTKTDRLLSTAVSSRRINEFIESSSAARTIIILDCCHSGAFKSGDIAGPVAGNGRYVLTSCRAKELANDASVANHASMFTEQVVAGIRGAATSRPTADHLTIEELHVYVRDRLLEQGRQRPQFITSGEGGLAIARRRTTSAGAGNRPKRRPIPGVGHPETHRDLGEVEAGEVLPVERVYVTARRRDGTPARWTAKTTADWVQLQQCTDPDRVEVTMTPQRGITRANIEILNEETGDVATVRMALRVRAARRTEPMGTSQPPADVRERRLPNLLVRWGQPRNNLGQPGSCVVHARGKWIRPVTPMQWSKQGFARAGPGRGRQGGTVVPAGGGGRQHRRDGQSGRARAGPGRGR